MTRSSASRVLFIIIAVVSVVAIPATTRAADPVTVAEILIPAAGNTPGANGTFFRSDIGVWNLRNVPQRVLLQWLPQAGSAAHPPVEVSIPAQNAIRSENFVEEYFGLNGLGSVLVTALSGDGQLDTNARLQVTSRIWTPQPDTTGTTSQSLPAVALPSISSPTAMILGLRRDERYRTNVGVVNLDPVHAQTFEIEVAQTQLSIPPEFYEITVPPMSMQLISLNALLQQPLFRVNITNTTEAGARSDRWTGFGSSVDNTTGDAWSELAIP